MIRLAVVLVTVSLSLNLVASDSQQTSFFSTFSLLEAFSLMPRQPSTQHDSKLSQKKKEALPPKEWPTGLPADVKNSDGYDPELPKIRQDVWTESRVRSSAWHPDSQHLAVDLEDHLEVLNIQTKQKDIFQYPIPQAKYSHDGKRLVSANADGTVALWDANKCYQKPLASWETTSALEGALFNPQDTQLASYGNDTHIRLWDINTHKCVAVFGEQKVKTHDLQWSDPATLVASAIISDALQTITVYDTRSNEIPLKVEAIPLTKKFHLCLQVACVDGNTIMFNDNGEQIIAIDRRADKQFVYAQLMKEITSFDVSKDGKVVLIYHADPITNSDNYRGTTITAYAKGGSPFQSKILEKVDCWETNYYNPLFPKFSPDNKAISISGKFRKCQRKYTVVRQVNRDDALSE